jgi:hypothetical protein
MNRLNAYVMQWTHIIDRLSSWSMHAIYTYINITNILMDVLQLRYPTHVT